MLKRLSLITALLGIFILLILLNFSPAIQVNSPSELEKLTENTKVWTSGRVISEKTYENTKILKLDNQIILYCSSCPSYINRTFKVVGIKESYNNRTEIRVLELKTP